MEVPSEVNQRWSMDFIADQLADGRCFRVLNVVDDFSRELIGQEIARLSWHLFSLVNLLKMRLLRA